MRKYAEVAKLYMKIQFAWRVDIFFQMLFTIVKILFAYLLWHLIYQGKSMVMGFSFDAMMTYYLMSSCLSQLDLSQQISEEISSKIRNGTFSKYLVLPIRMEGYFLSMEIGMVSFYLIFIVFSGVIWSLLFQMNLVFTSDVFVIAGTLLLILEGLIFMGILHTYLGILTLKYEGIGIFLMIKNNLMALMTGTFLPLILFPKEVVSLMKVLPFYYVTYLPSMLLLGKCKEELFRGIFTLLFWVVFVQLLLKCTWNTYKKAYDGVGI